MKILHDDSKSSGLPTRRQFLKTAGAATLALSAAPLLGTVAPLFARGPQDRAELVCRELFKTLTEPQRRALVLPWNDPRRLRANNNWAVVPSRISGAFNSDQQNLIVEILRGALSEQGFDKTMRAMHDDAGGLGNYHIAFFQDESDKLCFLLSGRHQTIRVDGGAEKNAIFGGPMFYGHAVDFNERPDHPGNVWWHQSRLASKVYQALDGRQQKLALVKHASPADRRSSVDLKGTDGAFTGLPGSELAGDQQELLEQVVRSLLEPYRESDVEEVLASIKTNGGLERLHVTFYKDGDLPDKYGIWDRWKLEGPAFAWYFRGSPHVHTWVNIAHKGGTPAS